VEGTGLRLRVPRQKADELLASLAEEGAYLLQTGELIEARDEADGWRQRYDRWVRKTEEALKWMFVGDSAADEFQTEARLGSWNAYDTWSDRHERWMRVLGDASNAVISFRERLEFAGESSAHPGPTPATGSGANIFVVHGHNESVKATVARFLERVAEPGVVVLSEQPDLGRTIIEKFEDYAASVGYAVVLLTGDDEGRKRGLNDELQARARQNVILELGFFIGTLGRGHVALVYEEGVELPSDIAGVLYLRLDPEGVWKTKLAGEMLAAGIALDAEAALRH
jgi:predicted nucleotide-binding protein